VLEKYKIKMILMLLNDWRPKFQSISPTYRYDYSIGVVPHTGFIVFKASDKEQYPVKEWDII
jgi:hypothetical protein